MQIYFHFIEKRVKASLIKLGGYTKITCTLKHAKYTQQMLNIWRLLTLKFRAVILITRYMHRVIQKKVSNFGV